LELGESIVNFHRVEVKYLSGASYASTIIGATDTTVVTSLSPSTGCGVGDGIDEGLESCVFLG